MRRWLPLLGLSLLACAKQQPLSWVSPASTGHPPPPCASARPELATQLATGLMLEPELVSALFPELALQVGWVARCELRSQRVERCGDQVVLLDPELRFWTRRGEALEVALVTEALVHPRMIMALQREALRPEPPPGAWLAPSRTSLRRVGPVVVGTVDLPPPASKP